MSGFTYKFTVEEAQLASAVSDSETVSLLRARLSDVILGERSVPLPFIAGIAVVTYRLVFEVRPPSSTHFYFPC